MSPGRPLPAGAVWNVPAGKWLPCQKQKLNLPQIVCTNANVHLLELSPAQKCQADVSQFLAGPGALQGGTLRAKFRIERRHVWLAQPPRQPDLHPGEVRILAYKAS